MDEILRLTVMGRGGVEKQKKNLTYLNDLCRFVLSIYLFI